MGLTIGNVLRRSFNQNKLRQAVLQHRPSHMDTGSCFKTGKIGSAIDVTDAVVVAVKQQVEAFRRGG